MVLNYVAQHCLGLPARTSGEATAHVGGLGRQLQTPLAVNSEECSMSAVDASECVRADLVVDVSGSCDIAGRLRVAATVFLPRPDALAAGATVVYALPGGGYSRGYFDMHFPGRAGYSQAEHHVSAGLVMVAIDHLGVGQSSPQVCDQLRVEDIAAANHAAVTAISRLLEQGGAAAKYPRCTLHVVSV